MKKAVVKRPIVVKNPSAELVELLRSRRDDPPHCDLPGCMKSCNPAWGLRIHTDAGVYGDIDFCSRGHRDAGVIHYGIPIAALMPQ
jgi:hypothetical protein